MNHFGHAKPKVGLTSCVTQKFGSASRSRVVRWQDRGVKVSTENPKSTESQYKFMLKLRFKLKLYIGT